MRLPTASTWYGGWLEVQGGSQITPPTCSYPVGAHKFDVYELACVGVRVTGLAFMPSLVKFIVRTVLVACVIFAGVYALAVFGKPHSRQMSVEVPLDAINVNLSQRRKQ